MFGSVSNLIWGTSATATPAPVEPQPVKVREETNAEEEKVIEQMRENLKDLSVDPQLLETKNLVRYLRARGHSLENGELMFRKQIEWRVENDMENILEWQVPSEYKTYWPWYLTGYDLLDNPVVILPMGVWDATTVGHVDYYVFLRYCFYSLESVWRLMQQKSVGKKMLSQFSIIVDLNGLSWKAVTTAEAIQGVAEAIRCFEASYPETLHVGFIVNSPYVFEIGWRIIKPFLSEGTQAKLRFLSGTDPTCWRNDLCQVMAPDQFPQKFGGDLPDTTEIHLDKGCSQTVAASTAASHPSGPSTNDTACKC